MEKVILVDEEDRLLGTAEKLAAHRDGGQLHRAFSIFIFDGQGRMLLQQRAAEKYHFRGKWTNACCGHPRLAESACRPPAASREMDARRSCGGSSRSCTRREAKPPV
jgi:isopentenyl-diphosphate delta-isomerase